MTIGIDISMLNYWGSGVANYTYQLTKNLLLTDKKNHYKLFFSSKNLKKYFFLDEFKKLGAGVYRYFLPMKLMTFFWLKNHWLPIDFLVGGCDLFFFSDFLRPPTSKKTKGITTIHDLTWKLYPEYHTQEVINAHQIKLQKTIKYGDLIIVDSKNTKDDLLNLYPQIDKDKVNVIYPGIDERFKPIKNKKEIEKVISKYLKNNLRFTSHVSRYILYVGAIEPRKNLDIAIKTFHQLLTTGYSQLATHFFITGQAGWKNKEIFRLVKDLRLENKVIFLGYIKDEDLPYFYSGAQATIYLSEYEGFGLPPLESAYCQTPVLLYQNSSLKELFNNDYPYAKKSSELETLIHLLKTKPNPKKYLKQDFSYKKTAEDFLKIINSL